MTKDSYVISRITFIFILHTCRSVVGWKIPLRAAVYVVNCRTCLFLESIVSRECHMIYPLCYKCSLTTKWGEEWLSTSHDHFIWFFRSYQIISKIYVFWCLFNCCQSIGILAKKYMEYYMDICLNNPMRWSVSLFKLLLFCSFSLYTECLVGPIT